MTNFFTKLQKLAILPLLFSMVSCCGCNCKKKPSDDVAQAPDIIARDIRPLSKLTYKFHDYEYGQYDLTLKTDFKMPCNFCLNGSIL